jgi:hypothetical protein
MLFRISVRSALMGLPLATRIGIVILLINAVLLHVVRVRLPAAELPSTISSRSRTHGSSDISDQITHNDRARKQTSKKEQEHGAWVGRQSQDHPRGDANDDRDTRQGLTITRPKFMQSPVFEYAVARPAECGTGAAKAVLKWIASLGAQVQVLCASACDVYDLAAHCDTEKHYPSFLDKPHKTCQPLRCTFKLR